MEQVHVGMDVYSFDTRIGVVEGVSHGDTAARPALIVRRDGGLLQAADADSYEVGDGAVRIDETLLQDVVDAASARQQAGEQAYASSTTAAQVYASSTTATQATDVDREELVVPVFEEQAVIGRRTVERGGVRVRKQVHEREELVEQPAFHEEVEVERVEIGKFVDVIPEPRQEGDTLIVPILEEVLVVEKRLVVKEELRITRRRTQETQQVRVTLRKEEATVERIEENQSGT